MNIALVCTGVGLVERGFERFTQELFELLRGDLPITLFGSGKLSGPNKVSLPCFKHNGWISILKGRERDHYYAQQLSYALFFIPFSVWRRYDIIHFSEPAMGNFLFHARRMFKFRYKLLFTEGLELDPVQDKVFFDRLDFIQALSPIHYQRLIQSGVPETKVKYLSYGFHSGHYLNPLDKEMLRSKYAIPRDKKVVLSVAALNRRHKRIDYLIRELSTLGDDIFLLVVGDPEEPDLIQMGRRLLGERFRSLYVSPDQMPEIYALADIFVHTALIEAFCLGLVEATAAGLPIIAHDSPHFEWLIGERKCLVDMRQEGNLAKKITELFDRRLLYERIAKANQESVQSRFDWQNLKRDYLFLYEQVLNPPRVEVLA